MTRARLLEQILASKRAEIAAGLPRGRHDARREPLDVLGALRRPPGLPLRLVAEVKLRSPSAGELDRTLDPAARALAYARAGATMISVLCDAPFFDGSFEHLASARTALDEADFAVPLLAKEFVIDEVQIAWAREYGADAVLLIARIVDPARLRELVGAARERLLEPLVEVVDERELGAALDAGASLIGVNARDLDTLAIDSAGAARVVAAIPADRVAIHLSGIKSAHDIRSVARSRADAALLGEALMRVADPEPLVHELVTAARG